MTAHLRLRLAQLESRMDFSDQFSGEHDMAADSKTLRRLFAQNEDLPLVLGRHLGAIVREARASARSPVIDLFAESITSTLDSVDYLATAGFAEASWFRVNDAFRAVALFLDAVTLQRDPQSVSPGAAEMVSGTVGDA